MQISRPVIAIIPSPSGRIFTYGVSSASWEVEYQSVRRFESEADAKVAGKKFGKEFDTEASKMEASEINRYHIMGTLTENGLFRAKRKVSSTFASLI